MALDLGLKQKLLLLTSYSTGNNTMSLYFNRLEAIYLFS